MSGRRLFLPLLAVCALSACGEDGSDCGEPIACADLAGEPDWAADSMDGLPDDFPDAPAGAELCGQSASITGVKVHWLVDPTEGVHEHYRAALTGIGWTASGPVSAVDNPDAGDVTCATEQVFTMGDPLVIVRVSPSRHTFSVQVSNLEN